MLQTCTRARTHTHPHPHTHTFRRGLKQLSFNESQVQNSCGEACIRGRPGRLLFTSVLVFMFPQEAMSNLTQKFCAISEENSLLSFCVLHRYLSSSTMGSVNQVILHWVGPGMEEQNTTHF